MCPWFQVQIHNWASHWQCGDALNYERKLQITPAGRPLFTAADQRKTRRGAAALQGRAGRRCDGGVWLSPWTVRADASGGCRGYRRKQASAEGAVAALPGLPGQRRSAPAWTRPTRRPRAMNDRAQGAFGRVSASISFVDPELIALGRETLEGWAPREPRLSPATGTISTTFSASRPTCDPPK